MKDIYGNKICQYEIGDTASFKSGVDPNVLFKGTKWIRLEGLTVVGYKANDADFGTVGKTLGSKTHTLINEESPPHSHTIRSQSGQYPAGSWEDYGYQRSRAANYTVIDANNVGASGGGKPHNNIQPSKVFNLWERTA